MNYGNEGEQTGMAALEVEEWGVHSSRGSCWALGYSSLETKGAQ